MRVYCKDKNEFIKLQRYLIDNCGYIWNNGDTEFYPPRYYMWDYGIIVITMRPSKELLYEPMDYPPSKNIESYTKYSDFMGKERFNNMKFFIKGVFKDII